MNYVSHGIEPFPGEWVENTNKDCKHYGSIGVVLSVGSLESDMGKTVTYLCKNEGDTWGKGEELTKTLDQLSPYKAPKITTENIRIIIRRILSESFRKSNNR